MTSLDQIVEHYIANWRPAMQRNMQFYANLPLTNAICKACKKRSRHYAAGYDPYACPEDLACTGVSVTGGLRILARRS
jgi:hypothetical protein